MSNFSPELKDSSYEQLEHCINKSSPVFGSLASDELTRRTIRKLEKTIEEFNHQSSKQTQKMIQLTYWIAGLTAVMVIGLVMQIIFAIPTKTSCIGESNSDGSRYTYICTTNITLGLLGNYSFQKEIISDVPMRFP